MTIKYWDEDSLEVVTIYRQEGWACAQQFFAGSASQSKTHKNGTRSEAVDKTWVHYAHWNASTSQYELILTDKAPFFRWVSKWSCADMRDGN